MVHHGGEGKKLMEYFIRIGSLVNEIYSQSESMHPLTKVPPTKKSRRSMTTNTSLVHLLWWYTTTITRSKSFQNTCKFCFTILEIQFIYTFRFMSASLTMLVQHHLVANFKITIALFTDPQQLKLVTCKGKFPYSNDTSLRHSESHSCPK
ncbi:hypothetical protein PR048_016488 [Dryococelus australis]|uniref:Uncharacterized protein n=1 Tax=Dryococelus australis TaxID=614101 RepID=A0ABQ9HKF5_9NEOP|nr:hypothetical protein PR048_016488 [Dryococelus australis]